LVQNIATVYILTYCLIFHLDIDECEEGIDGCDHNCTNTDGSYYCTCMDGYELDSDNHTCTYVHGSLKYHNVF